MITSRNPMRRLISAAVFWALMLGGVNALSRPASPPQDRKESGVISGRVTLDGRPAQGVMVVASPMGLDPAKMLERMLNQSGSARSTTDSDGRYRIEGLSAGSYNVSPSAPTLVTLEAAGGTKEVIVAEDATVERIDFALARGGVISGRITDTEGAPVIAALISLKPDDSAIPNFSPREVDRMFFTDDRGIYRIFGLPPGRYLVNAGDSDNSPYGRVFTGQRRVRTYYPGVTDFQKAKPVEVTAGTETLGIDIKLGVAAKGFVVNGHVVESATRKPISNAMVMFGPKPRVSDRVRKSNEADEDEDESDDGDDQPGTNGYSLTDAKGEFRLNIAAPGSYQARVESMRDMFGGSEYYSEPVEFELRSANIENLEIPVHRGASISGVVVLENGATPEARDQLAQLFLRVEVVDEEAKTGSHGVCKVAADGSFRIAGLKGGKAKIDTSSVMGLAKLALVRIERDGIEQSDGFAVQPNEQITAVRIVVGEANCVIRGHVTLQGGSLPSGSVTSVTAVRLSSDYGWGQWGNRADAKGEFVIENLAPGSYAVQAYTMVLSSAGTKRASSDRQIVTITRDTPGEVTLVLDLNAK